MLQKLRIISAIDADVSVIGDVDTKKEVAVRAMHDISSRVTKPFVVINCADLTAMLIDSELCSQEASIFPNLIRTRYVRLENACGGTVLLHYIVSMPADMPGLSFCAPSRTVPPFVSVSNEPISDVRFIATSKAVIDAKVAA